MAMVVVMLLLTSFSAAAMPVAWDCYLPQGPVDCQALLNAYFQGGLFKHDEEHPKFRIKVRAQRVQTSVKVVLEYSGSEKESTHFKMREWMPASLEKDASLMRITGALQRGSAPFLDAEGPGKAQESGLTLELHDASLAKGVEQKADESKWFIEPRLWGNMNSEGLFRLGGGASLALNWSMPTWRIRSNSGVFYRLLSTEIDAGQVIFERLGLEPPWSDDDDEVEEQYEALSAWNVSTFSYDLYKGLSVGSKLLLARDPNDNQSFVLRPQVGVEWLWRPFLQSDGTNFGVRYQVGGEFVVFERENIRHRDHEVYGLHSLEAFASLHLGRVDASFGAGGKSIVDDLEYSSIFGNLNVTWRITDALYFTGSTRGAFRNALINEPLEASDNSLEYFAGGGNYGDITYRIYFTLSYTFGNALLRSQDQRWRLGA
ncbi:MAG: hypothetical protein GY822_13990 [Deltaproteobacteria bacterium]|nr:hypothetical protein [Deltaproteobacteria bacterium]